jgi:transposase
MAFPQKEPLRTLSEQEKRALQRIVKATSQRLDVVRRAKAVLAVASGQAFTKAAHEAGLKSGDGVGKLVKRFNQHGLAALQVAAGRGRKETYTSAQRVRMVAEVQRAPDRKADQTATWSLKTLERTLRKQGFSKLSASTIREVLHEAGYAFGKTRTWCPTGTAKRKRKAGVVTVQDPRAQEKKD